MKKIKISRAIYSDKTIESTAKIYQSYADITINYTKEYAVLIFSECKYNESQTIKEFENYMIGTENSKWCTL